MKSNFCFSFFLFFISLNLGAQVKLSGYVKDQDQIAVPYCNVILKDSVNARIVKYTQTNKEGYYSLSINTAGYFDISFSALSFKTETIPICIDRDNSVISQNAILSNSLVELKEVVIHPNSPIIIKKDTIIFDAKSFTRGNEHVVEDLLKNLPGVHIDSDGHISVAGKEVEKVMVEGDDFFEKGYQLLTKSMLSSSIDKIELLKRYSNNKLLKDIEQSDKIALNLKLKDENKREWFGNTDIGLGLNKFSNHDVQGNLMNFGKKDKYYLLANTNNVGYDIGDYAANNSLESIDEIGDGESAFKFMRFVSDPLDFENKRTNFNNTNLLSLNAILKPLQKLRIKMSFLIDRNKSNFANYSSGYYRTENLSFTNILDSKLHSNSRMGYGKVDITYDISPNSMLEVLTNYRNEYDMGLNNNMFNDTDVAEHLETNRIFFNQKIRFTYRAKNKQILKITTNYIQDEAPQNYITNKLPFYASLFPDIQKTNDIAQCIRNKMKFIGVDVCYMKKQNDISFFEFHLGNSYRKDVLASFIQDKATMKVIEKYRNDVACVLNNLFFNSKYSLSYKKILVTAELGFNNNFNFLTEDDIKKKKQPFNMNPSLSLEWRIKKRQILRTSYLYNYEKVNIADIYSHYILTSFNSLNKGTGELNQLGSSLASLNYQLGNWSDVFFANIIILYRQCPYYYSSNSILTSDYSLSEKNIARDNQHNLKLSTTIDRFLNPISTNLKLIFSADKSNSQSKINNEDLRDIKVLNYNYGVELRSSFRGLFNFYVGTRWNTSRIKSTYVRTATNNKTFLDAFFVFNERFNISLSSEMYHFHNIGSNKIYPFLDLGAKYVIKKNKLSFLLSANNLTDTRTFTSYLVNDFYSMETRYKLLPILILLKVEYRF